MKSPGSRLQRLGSLCAIVAFAGFAGGCSIRKLAVNKVSDALAGGGTAMASDDDPDLIRQAAPFSLKLMESLLAESPHHQALLQAAAGGFTQYAYAFVQQDADEIEARDFPAAEALRARAKKLYARARNYGLRSLEVAHPGFTNNLAHNVASAAARLKKADVPAVYWTAAAWGSLISLSKDDPSRVAEIPQMEALIDRAALLDPDWGKGSIQGFLIQYEMSRQGAKGGAAERARKHFERAVVLGNNRLAAPYVSYAEAVCVEKQDSRGFENALGKALEIDVEAAPESRLVNTVMQRRARWLLTRKDDLFLTPAPPSAR